MYEYSRTVHKKHSKPFSRQDKNTPSHNDNHIDAVRVLLQAKGIDINLADKNGCTPLYLAVVYGCVDTVKVLSQAKGIDVNAANEDGQTPLHLVALLGCIGIVKALLQAKGIDVNARDKNGCTPLLLRLSTQYIPDIAKAVGINISVTAPALFLDENNNKKIVDTLMEKGADPLLQNNDDRTPIDFDKNGYIRQFLEKKAKKNGLYAGGASALLGTAAAVALFATGTVAVELIPIVIAVTAIATTALVVGGATYMMLKPSTKMDGVKEKQGLEENEQKI